MPDFKQYKPNDPVPSLDEYIRDLARGARREEIADQIEASMAENGKVNFRLIGEALVLLLRERA